MREAYAGYRMLDTVCKIGNSYYVLQDSVSRIPLLKKEALVETRAVYQN